MGHYVLADALLMSLLFAGLRALPSPAHDRSHGSTRSADSPLKLDREDNLVSLQLGAPPKIIANLPTAGQKDKVEVCDELNAPGRYMIYCSGKLLQAVMAVKLYNDSKTFVDKPIKAGRVGSQILSEFEKKFPQPVHQIPRADVKKFVDENFDEEGFELQSCKLADWVQYPPKFKSIVDNNMRMFALKLNVIWKELCREVKPEVMDSPERFSLLHVPYPFVVPGGRFREFYYWDAYWIVKGLIASNLTDTAKSMILNFAHIIDTYGFIPNGGRVYYLRRSQPPLFSPMVYEYYQATRDKDLVREMLPIMEKEQDFWNRNRSLNIQLDGETITVYQYRTPSTVPRPESYREDAFHAERLLNTNRKRQFYQDIASAAESGWDFSTRWFADNKSLTSIETTNILPVDLNAFICYNMHIIGNLHGEVGNQHKSSAWLMDYIKFRENFEKVFWVQDAKGWYDYNLRTKRHNTDFYASMAVPLFTQCYEPLSLAKSDDLYSKMEEMGVFSYKGGIPTSLIQGDQQWDFPNGWSPLNHMIVEGLRKSSDPRMQQKAFVLAQKWILGNLHVFENDQAMWEKYDVVSSEPRLGGGGEYDVQPGFGWTNGAALDLLVSYGDRLVYTTAEPASDKPADHPLAFNYGSIAAFTMTTVISSFMYLYVLL